MLDLNDEIQNSAQKGTTRPCDTRRVRRSILSQLL